MAAHDVVLGRDARTSGAMFAHAATAGLQSVGVNVIDLGVVPTPTVQMAVMHHGAGAGLILTASHNPIEWNALKFVGPDGIFLDAGAGAAVRALAEAGPPRDDWSGIGAVSHDDAAIARHLDAILALAEIDAGTIRARELHVALDCVRGAGGPTMLALFDRLGVRVSGINLEPDGRFPREPEPIPENLGALGELVQQSGADIGMAVDPDVDRLALVDETGRPIGEDYTLAIAARAVLATARQVAPAGGGRQSLDVVGRGRCCARKRWPVRPCPGRGGQRGPGDRGGRCRTGWRGERRRDPAGAARRPGCPAGGGPHLAIPRGDGPATRRRGVGIAAVRDPEGQGTTGRGP